MIKVCFCLLFVNARHEERLKEWEQNCRKGLIEKYNPIWFVKMNALTTPARCATPPMEGNIGGNDEGFLFGILCDLVLW